MRKKNHDVVKSILKVSFNKAKEKREKERACLELNFYVQKMMMEYPTTYIKEIKKDIEKLSITQ